MISIVINADTRPPMDRETFTVGDDGGQGSLHGCRSWDYLVDLPKAVHKFFEGHEHEVILYIDEHEKIPDTICHQWENLVAYASSNDKMSHRWNDKLYLNSLAKAKGDYVVKMDQDACIFRDPSCDIVDRYLKWLDEGYKFICQPTNLTKQQHGMWWASTRFFICKRETLDFESLWNAVDNPTGLFAKYSWSGPNHFPCLEHLLGVTAGDNGVLYPPREDDNYLVFSWARYVKGTIKKLLDMTYSEAAKIVAQDWGLCGPNDVLARPLP